MAYHVLGTNDYLISTHRTATAAVKAYWAYTRRERACLRPSTIRIKEAVSNRIHEWEMESRFFFTDGSIVDVDHRLDRNGFPVDMESVIVTLIVKASNDTSRYDAQVAAIKAHKDAIQAQIEAEQAAEDAKLAAHYAAIQAELEQMEREEREEWIQDAPHREAYLAKMEPEAAGHMAAFYRNVEMDKFGRAL